MTDPTVAALGLAPASLAALIADLRSRGHTVATAESLTGGLVAAALTSVPGASAVVRGGLVVYATALKHTMAGVDRDLLDRVGAVHPEVARQLAAGARDRCGATIGLGLTGVAGPESQDGQAVGTVFLCLDAGGERREVAAHFTGDRATIRAAAVRRGVALLAEFLASSARDEKEPPGRTSREHGTGTEALQ